MAMVEFDRMAATPLWPGFDPRTIPVAIYDGQHTWLFHHPAAPAEFAPVPAHLGIAVFTGRHESMRGNTSVTLNGIATATVTIQAPVSAPRELAAIAIHEAFHVYQRAHHPDWTANEVDLFTYPMELPDPLALRRLETYALTRALSGSSQESTCWSRTLLALRRARYAGLPAPSATYERGSELNEGLANYVERRSLDRGSVGLLPDSEYPVDAVRLRSYAVGTGLALLLDRFAPGWAVQLNEATVPLDSLLRQRLGPTPASACSIPRERRAAEVARAGREIEDARRKAASDRLAFLTRPGWTIVVEADSGAPLWPQNFDPWNVRRLSSLEVLHSRWVKVGNRSGAIEVLNAQALTVGSGPHPLFNGIRSIRVTGIGTRPLIETTDSLTTVQAGEIKAEFRNAVLETQEQEIVLRLRP